MELLEREKRNLERIYPYLGECALFLKRDESFPLKKPCSIAAYGRGVRHTIKGGSGSGEVNSRFFITIEEGLESAGFNIVSNDWLDQADAYYPLAKKKWIKEVKKEARKMKMLAPIYGLGRAMPEPNYDFPLNYEAEAAIYVISRMSGEGSDRKIVEGDILLTESEIRDIYELSKRYEKFMLVINAGGVVDLSKVQNVRNILLLSELGAETGRAFADILLGKMNPSGKLTATWAYIDDYPYEKDIPLVDTYYKEGRYVGYRYFDSFNVEPIFPFGFGLSYTKFKIDNYSVSNEGKNIEISVDVKNIGDHSGKEVVQVYISYLGKEEAPYQELVAFKKTSELSPGKEETLKIEFDLSNIARYSVEREQYYLENGDYLIRVGNSSRNTEPVGLINLSTDIVIKETKNIYSYIQVAELQPSFIKENNVKLPKISLNQMDFPVVSYQEETVDVPEVIKDLSTNELVSMNIGYIANQKSLSFVGESSTAAPGAAGEVSSVFAHYFKNHVVMADGPAGLRLARSYCYKGKKIIKLDHNSFLTDALEFTPRPLKWFLTKMLLKEPNVDKNEEIFHQYCTALPIGTALAQSFNIDLAFTTGDIVGEEMEEYKIDLWLAPAMNIQRTIMCGRNFEYYSEDPYLTGMMAAYITRGVQSHKDKGVVIKHFAANNQETFRYTNNSVVDEDALREIYLRGYEICIKEANPKGVMSSYNLINGQHSSECNELIKGFLFNENNFKGVVMTDWIMRGSKPRLASYDISRVENVYKASTSLFMPGSKYDYKQLKKDVKKHKNNRAILEANATRLYKNFSK